MSVKTNLDTPQKADSVENKNLSKEDRFLKDIKAQNRLDYLVRTRNKIWAIVKFK